MNGIYVLDKYNKLLEAIVALGVGVDYAREFKDYKTSTVLRDVRNDLEKELAELAKKLSEVEL